MWLRAIGDWALKLLAETPKAIVTELTRSFGIINTAGIVFAAIFVVQWDRVSAMLYNLGLAYFESQGHATFTLAIVPPSAPRWEGILLFAVCWPPCLYITSKACDKTQT